MHTTTCKIGYIYKIIRTYYIEQETAQHSVMTYMGKESKSQWICVYV